MSLLFSPGKIGTLELPNRLVRSATAENLADKSGKPYPACVELYRSLAKGGVGLIITGHMFVHPSGKAHSEMSGIYTDEMIPSLSKIAEAVHQEGGKVVVQINHGGMQCAPQATDEVIAPSNTNHPFLKRQAREMTLGEIDTIIRSYGKAARRVKQAGFDGVQIHGAHGYLVTQFLSPIVNHRTDFWGGTPEKRMNFLKAVCESVRSQVGADYPVLIKLGMVDGYEGGLTIDDGVKIVSALEGMGINGIEISGAIGGPKNVNTKPGIRSGRDEGYFIPMAQAARTATQLPIILVGGFRTKQKMEDTLSEGKADFISLCRPLISEPDLPYKFQQGLSTQSRCISGNRCFPKNEGEGVRCKCLTEGD